MTPQEAIDILSTLAGYENTVALILDYSVTVQDALHMAIKALEQQPCEDCISREEAIRIAEQGQIQGYEWQFKKLCNLPSVTPKASWIPVSERLPEDGRTVLVWYEYFRYGDYNKLFQTYGLSYAYGGHWSEFVNGESGWKDLRIIAWMPLPEPYKAERSDSR